MTRVPKLFSPVGLAKGDAQWRPFALALVALTLLVPSIWPTIAHAGTRVALVVSKGAYQHASPLDNPKNDAAIVKRSLEQVGFKVIAAGDQGIDQFRRSLKSFREAAEKAEVALVYYAGHGIEAKGVNWLIPVDAKLVSEQDLPDEAVDLQRVLDSVQGAKLRVVILDACRNNPFGRQWKTGTRSVNRGLSGLDADDVLVIFAAAPGQLASDGTGGNSRFARALAERIPQADLPVQLLGGVVRDDVLRATNSQQRPYVSASITGTPYYLAGRAATGAAATVPPTPTPATIKPTAAVKFSIASIAAQDANFRQARNKLRDGIVNRGMAWAPLVRDADVLFTLVIGVARSEDIGSRKVEVTLDAICRPFAPGAVCPATQWRGSAIATGPNFDSAEERAIDQAADQLALKLAPDFGPR